jgi:hypothetical protein
MAKRSAALTTRSSSSTKSSTPSSLARKASSVKKAVANGVKAITKPFKKLKRTSTSDTLSSATLDADVETSSQADVPSPAGSTESDVIDISDDSFDPEKELGECYLILLVILLLNLF